MQLSLHTFKSGRDEFWNVLAFFLLDVGSESFGVGHSVHRHARYHLIRVGFTSHDLSGRRSRWAESLGHDETNWDTSDSLTSLLLQNDLQVSWFSDIQEVLGVSAPELVLFSLFIHTSTTAGCWTPLALELLLNGVWELNQLDWVRGENTEEEWSLLLGLVLGVVSVWYYHVMAGLLIVLRAQPASLGDLTIAEPLETLGRLHYDVTFVDLPKSISLRLYSDNQKVHGYVWPLRHFFIFLHQTENNVRLFRHRDSKLRVVEPSIIGVVLDILADLALLLWVDVNWVWTTGGVAVPLS